VNGYPIGLPTASSLGKITHSRGTSRAIVLLLGILQMTEFDSTKTRPDSDLDFANLPTEYLPSAPVSDDGAEIPNRFRFGDVIHERYEVREQLGRGSFGAVFAAFDRSLNRTVAIKQSNGLRSFRAGQVRDEARAVAALNHPNIIQIHDLIQLDATQLLIVMECLEGIPLSKRLMQSRLSAEQAVNIGIEIAAALIHAHGHHLVHSDLKPANIFLCNNNSVKLLDFGLAIAYTPSQIKGTIGGTPGYMSPEQSRGESHLIDGRSDIWAFGVVLYEMLAGERPYSAERNADFREGKLGQAVAPLRQLNPQVDNELQRIVMKCLEPLIRQRYDSASQLLEDLTLWFEDRAKEAGTKRTRELHLSPLNSPVPASPRMGNRGLQPFTELDGEAYLPLVPGQRDRNGIPESINFWRRWVESDDPDLEYPVGILYGPSGSGKTSYIRAGLFRHLSPHVCRVYIESRPGNLAERLTRSIESQIRSESGESSLRDLLHRLRSGQSSHRFRKLLIVLDQFEAWAHTATLEERIELAEALRQCDGRGIRALVVTRVDFWSGVTELLHWLEMPIQEGRNVAAVELLAPAQAQQILESMGRDANILPPEGQPLSAQQRQFITDAVDELTINGAVICIHLVMFAQMVKFLKWTPRALRDSGGVAGACSLFLQELFGSSERHSPEYHRVSATAQIVLSALVPDADRRVSDVIVSCEQLERAVAEVGQSHLLKDCLRVLCEDLRMVTAVGDDGESFQSNETSSATAQVVGAERYRLAHDFLVEPVSTFLDRMKRRSWSGRANSRLTELSDAWSRRPHPTYLPGFGEYLSLMVSGFFQKRNDLESRYLKAATRRHAGKISATTATVLALVAVSLFAWNRWSAAAAAEQRELVAIVDSYFNGSTKDLSNGIADLVKFGNVAVREVEQWQDSVDQEVQLRARLFLQTQAPTNFSAITPLLAVASPDWFESILAIAQKTADAKGELIATLATNVSEKNSIRAAILLAHLGDDSHLTGLLAGSVDANKDNALLKESVVWGHAPEVWSKILNAAQEPTVIYHAGIVLAAFSPEEMKSASTSSNILQLINSPDATTSSVGRYLANHLGEDVFSIPLNPPANANWRLGPDNTPMVLVEPAKFEYSQSVSQIRVDESNTATLDVERPFWMATLPVSQRLYAEFVAENETLIDNSDARVSLDGLKLPAYLIDAPNQPMVGTNLAQAYCLCNFLSRRAGLQECYSPREVEGVIADRGQFTLEPIPWNFDPTANGIRVPTPSEFKLSAQCRYERGFPWQHTLDLPRANLAEASRGFPLPLFHFAPSRYGIFVFHTGTWTSGDITSLSVVANGYRPGVATKQFAAVNAVIFLAQNAIQ
jgi:serine/threonine protein kinase/formylglycine-generating enzyme required for sulfatase activity